MRIEDKEIDLSKDELNILSIKELIAEIKKQAINLKENLISEKDIEEKNKALGFFDERMQATVYYTLKNIEGYMQYGWKELFYEGENLDERDSFIGEND